MLLTYSKNSIDLNESFIEPLHMDETLEETTFVAEFDEYLEKKVVSNSNTAEIINRLVNLKLDVNKQANVKIDKKILSKFLNLVLPESVAQTKIHSKYSYAATKEYLLELKKLVNSGSLSLGQCLEALNMFEDYEEENKNTINPVISSFLLSIAEVKKVVISKLYLLLLKKTKHFRGEMDKLISLYESKTFFDEVVLEETLDEMNSNIDLIYTIYRKYFENDIALKILYTDIIKRKERILEIVSVENKK